MAISAPVQRVVGAASTTASANTTSYTPAANALQLVFVNTARAAGASTVPTVVRSALNMVWVAGIAYVTSGTHRRVDVFRQMQAAPAAGAATIAYAGQVQDTVQWEIVDIAGVLTTGTSGADAVRQVVTRATSTDGVSSYGPTGLLGFSSFANATIIGAGTAAAATFTAHTNYTISGQGTSGANAIAAAYRLFPDLFPAIVSNQVAAIGLIGIEVVSAVGAATGTLTARPNGTVSTGGWGLTGAATHHLAHNDNSDASYSWVATTPSGILSLAMDDLWPGTYNTRLVSMTQRYRLAMVGGTFSGLRRSIEVFGTTATIDDVIRAPSAIATLSYVWGDSPNGDPWNYSSMFDLKVRYELYYYGGSECRIYETYVDLLFNDRPVAAVTYPTSGSTVTTTTRPPFTWTYSDPEGDAQERWHVKVFTAAQYGAGGFDPQTSTPYTESLEQVGSAVAWTPTVDLPNGVYRVYIKVSDVGANGLFGLWTYVEWTQNVVAPTVPTLTAAAEDSVARVRLFVQGSGVGPGDPPNHFNIEYSDDGGVTWAALRNGSTLTPSGTYSATVYDYEAPPGIARSYRANAVRIVGTLSIGSAWSATATATQTLAAAWLKDPLDPTVNYAITCGPFIEGEERKERIGVFEPYGADFPVVVAGSLMGWDGSTTIYAFTAAERAAIEALLAIQRSLLFQSPEGTSRYLRIITRRRDRHTCDTWGYPVTYLETEAP